MRAIAVAVLLVFCVWKPSQSKAQTTQDLLGLCNSPLSSARGACLGYVTAISDLMQMNGIELAAMPATEPHGREWLTETSICIPYDEQQPTKQAVVQVFTNWATSHPQYWSEDELTGVSMALVSMWACMQ